MKIINLPRGKGKTHRLIVLSEHNQIPILCANRMMARYVEDKAKREGYKIPKPMYVDELFYRCGHISTPREVYVDEIELVMKQMLNLCGLESEVGTISMEEYERDVVTKSELTLTLEEIREPKYELYGKIFHV